MKYKSKMFAFQREPEAKDGDVFEGCNLSQRVPTEMFKGKKITLIDCNAVNCIFDEGVELVDCNNAMVDLEATKEIPVSPDYNKLVTALEEIGIPFEKKSGEVNIGTVKISFAADQKYTGISAASAEGIK